MNLQGLSILNPLCCLYLFSYYRFSSFMRACPHLQSHVVCGEWVLWRNPRGLGHALTLFHSIFISSSLWTVKANCLSLELPSIHSFQSVGRGRRRRNKSQSGWPSVTENLLSVKEKKKKCSCHDHSPIDNSVLHFYDISP